MAILHKRSEFTDGASAKASSAWNNCMSKPMCKYPAILAIILAILILLTIIYFALRCLSCCCCDCLSGGRYRRGKRKQYKYADLHASPYNNNDNATAYKQPTAPPPGYHPSGQQQPPPQYAQFQRQRGDDSLPAMPRREEMTEKRVFDSAEGYGALRKEAGIGKLEREKEYETEQRQPMLHDPAPGYAEMDGSRAGDLGMGPTDGYRPYGQAYTPYSPVGGGGGQGKGCAWKNV
ncbi:MAG: hypothetical protein Q9213_007915 [Squamulea squamosa]